jgi:hypothetical protein
MAVARSHYRMQRFGGAVTLEATIPPGLEDDGVKS